MRTNLQAILTKVQSNHSNLSREYYTGWLFDRPCVGQQLHMNTREEGQLWTTPIKTVRFIAENEVEFDTQNSTYRLHYVSEDTIGSEVCLTPLEADILSVFVKHHIPGRLNIISFMRDLEKKLCGRSNA